MVTLQDIEAGRAPYAPMICAGTTTGYKVHCCIESLRRPWLSWATNVASFVPLNI